MISNYTPETCRYAIDKLRNAVYLVSEDALKDIRIDNGNAYVNSISETPIKLECYGLSLSEEESLDERYKFIHTLKFSVNGYANSSDFHNKYYVIVRDYEDTWWLINPLFPCKVTYTYTLGYQQNHTDFSIGTASNHPVLKLNGMSDASSYQCKEYFLDGIDKLLFNEKRYTAHVGSSVKYTNDGFKEVAYNKNSAIFTESFDGENTSHKIDFDILLSSYKSSWHYSLLEFKDNLYSAVIKTTDGKYALCGFSLGLQPVFTINADDTVSNGNKISISLQDSHDAGDSIEMFNIIGYEQLTEKTWVYTSQHNGYECVDDGAAKYLLKAEMDALGNETGNYQALQGYSSQFPDLNIVGEFNTVEYFSCYECKSNACSLTTSFPSVISFNSTGCLTYYVKADSNWSISSSQNYITVSPSTGTAGVGYTVEVCNTLEATPSAQTGTLTVSYCNTSMTVDVEVYTVPGGSTCIPGGTSYNATPQSQTLTIPTICCVRSVDNIGSYTANTTVYSNYIQVYLPTNNTGNARDYSLLVTYCDGTTDNITITQNSSAEKWVVLPITEAYWCDDCGYVPPTPEQHRTISGSAYCTGVDKYVDVYSQVSYDSGQTWETTATTKTLLEHNSEDCGYGERWRDIPISQDYWCDDCSYLEKWVVIPINEDYWCDECQ